MRTTPASFSLTETTLVLLISAGGSVMRLSGSLVAGLVVTLLLCFGGCILDSDDGCDTDNMIVGYVCDMAGQPMPGVKIRALFDPMEGVDPVPDCSTYTGSNGCYRLAFPADARDVYVFTVGDGCVFSPYGRIYNEPTGTFSGQNFVGYCGETYTISGRVEDAAGRDLAGIYITATDADGFWRDDTVTDALGLYVLDGLAPNVDYVVTPSGFCDFTPRYRTYDGVRTDLTDQDFTAGCARTRLVAGYVLDAYRQPLEGIAIETWCICITTGLARCIHTIYTDADGHYEYEIIATPDCGCYLIPKSDSCRFVPHVRTYSDPEEDLTDENYTAYCGDGYDIEGYVHTPGGNPCEGTYLHMWRRDWPDQEAEYIWTSTDATGYYKFDNLVPGASYHILPSTNPFPWGDTCPFDPPERTYSVLEDDMHDQNFVQDCPG
jgi:protocatechuate 3,4-dioxygenase beta subunit